MSAEDDRHGDDGLDALVRLSRNQLDGEAPRRDAATFERVQAALDAERAPRRRSRWVLAACVLSVALGVWLSWRPSDEPLALRAERGSVSSSGEVGAERGAVLSFSDGTRVEVAEASDVQVEAVTSRGADVRLQRGRVKLDVVKRPEARWAVAAGPYRVRVTGTSFSVTLDESERLTVELFEGHVVLSGPLVEGLALDAGQRLVVDEHASSLSYLGAEHSTRGDAGGAATRAADLEVGGGEAAEVAARLPEAPEPEETTPAASAPEPARTRPARTRASPRPAEPRELSWRERVAAGRSAEVLAAARAMGLTHACEQSSGEDLEALADAARYARRPSVARAALLALRKRFADGPQATRAAFFLGRLAESEGAESEATRWFEAYLAQAPTGAYAEQALGRRFALIEKLRGPAAARNAAREYLSRFPHGTRARAARRLAGEPNRAE